MSLEDDPVNANHCCVIVYHYYKIHILLLNIYLKRADRTHLVTEHTKMWDCFRKNQGGRPNLKDAMEMVLESRLFQIWARKPKYTWVPGNVSVLHEIDGRPFRSEYWALLCSSWNRKMVVAPYGCS